MSPEVRLGAAIIGQGLGRLIAGPDLSRCHRPNLGSSAAPRARQQSTAQGVWQPTESGGCAVTHAFYNADLQGNLVNTVEIRIVLTSRTPGSKRQRRL
jgi:hypothetical protein